mgnify:CR=1 FL=1
MATNLNLQHDSVVMDHLAALETTGFRRLYILNGHGGNLAPIRSALAEFYAARSLAGRTVQDGLVVRVRSWCWCPCGMCCSSARARKL